MVRKTIPTHDEDPATENNQGALRVDQTSRQHLIVTETVCDRKQTKNTQTEPNEPEQNIKCETRATSF